MTAATGPTTFAEFVAIVTGWLSGGPTPPTPPPLVERVYGALPAAYRRSDTAGILRRYLQANSVVAGALELLIDGIDYVAPDEGGDPADTSLLVDPAETPWPTWLAWLAGVDLTAAGIPPGEELGTEARELIAAAVNGHKAGSAGALAAAARRTLTGTRTVIVRAGLDPDPHLITISTVTAETPDPDALLAAVRAVTPAGHGLAFDNAVGNWRGIEALGPWGDIETAAPTWGDLEAAFA